MKKNNVLIIGSSGYIGSRLVEDLSPLYDVITCDIKPNHRGEFPTYHMDYGKLKFSDIEYINNIIILAGYSSVADCDKNRADVVLYNNVTNFQRLLNMTAIKPNIKIIYASSASVYGKAIHLASEQNPLPVPVNKYDSSKQIIDIIARMYMPDMEIYGLRFGTVNGPSPNMRWDLIINAMYKSAAEKGFINVHNPDCFRSIVSTTDISNAIQEILKNDDPSKKGIYNLASATDTVGGFARDIASLMNCKIIRHHGDSSIYNFRLDTWKFFCQFPGWKQTGTTGQIIKELKGLPLINKDGTFTYNLQYNVTPIMSDYYLTSSNNRPYIPLTKCLCCESQNLSPVIDLGDQPLANNFHDKSKVLEKYPLQLNVCTECFHCQLSIAVDPKLMFTDYKYVSGTTDTLKEYFKWFANYVRSEHPSDFLSVLDIGCNDGSQLDEFRKLNAITVGIDPAENLCKVAREKGHIVANQYFNKDFQFYFKELTTKFDCIIAQNVFAHNSNPLEFLKKCEQYLDPATGTLYIQVSQADMILNGEFDTIYHEHISFFNINSMNTLIGRTKTLYLADVIKTPIHGNSYIFVIKKSNPNKFKIDNLINLEKNSGLYDINTYKEYASNIQNLKLELKILLESIDNVHTKIIGYGAAAKGMTVLNYMDLPMDFIIDDNPLKQGLYSPGTDIPIVSILDLKVYYDAIDLVFVPLAWNFFTEIKSRIQKMNLPNKIRWVKYFPKVQITENI